MNFLYWILCIIIGLLPAFFVFQKDRKRNIPVKWLPSALRFLCFFFTAALLLAPAFPAQQTREEKPVLIWLQDNSLSMQNALKGDSALYRKKTEALWKEWSKSYKVVPVAFGARLVKDSIFTYYQQSTDIASALGEITEQYQDQNLGAIILAGDGNFNQGMNPLFRPRASGIPVYTIGLGDSTVPKDILVGRIAANKEVPLHSTFEIIADVEAVKLAGIHTEAFLQEHGETIARSAVTVNQSHFNATLRFTVRATKEGLHRYTVVLPQLADEKNTKNNEKDVFVNVTDKKTQILLMAAAPHPDVTAIKAALSANEQYKLTIQYGKSIPRDINRYDLIIVHQIPSHPGTRFQLPENIPVWYILGDQSDVPAFSIGQSLLHISRAGSAGAVLPLFHPEFNLFTLPPSIKEVLDKMPPLQVPSGTYTASASAQVLFNQKIGNVATDYPLWLFQPGPVAHAVLAGTGLWRWRIFEYKNFHNHNVVDELIRQTVSLLTVSKDHSPFRVFTDKQVFNDNGPLTIYAELRNDNSELINGPEAKLILKDSLGRALNYTFEKAGNRYQLNLGLLAPGSYSFQGKVHWNNENFESHGAFQVENIPLEQLKTYADFALLYQIAHQSDGRFFTLQSMGQLTDSLRRDPNMKTVLHADTTYLQLIDRKWLFFLILLIAAAEWLLRKYWSL